MGCIELRKLAVDCMGRGGEPVGDGPPELELRPLDFWSFLYFMRRFWNQILIWRSDRLSKLAISTRRGRHRYRLKWNSFSSSTSWALVYAVRARFDDADDPLVGLFSPLLPLSAPPDALPELLLGEQFFCLVVCRHSFIQGKICLARVGLGGSEEEADVEEDVEEEELDDLLGPDLETEEAPALPPGC